MFLRNALVGLFILAGCQQKPQPDSDLNSLSSNVATQEVIASGVICDAVVAQRAEKLMSWATAGLKSGVMTKVESEKLQKFATEVLACVSASPKFQSSASASTDLESMKVRYKSGTASQIMVFDAQQKLVEANFCESSMANIQSIEVYHQKRADAGVGSLVDFVSPLQKRLNLMKACALY